MLEPQRPILLPPPDSAGSTRARAAAVAPWAPAAVTAIPPLSGAAARDARDAETWARRPLLEDEADTGATGNPRRTMAGPLGGGLSGGQSFGTGAGAAAPFASAAFLAQQIYQEAMPSGLHLEPWTQGIGAYRRAGAAPPLDSSAPALFSVAV